MKLTFAVVVLFLTVASSFAEDKNQSEQTDKLFAEWDSTVSPGCALSVMKDGHIIYKRGYGIADLDHGIPITPETVFHVASISKQFTAMAILLLAKDGKLSLHDDVHKYIKELPDFGTPITIEHLIHHTSGLRDQWELLELAGWRYSLDLITDQDVLDLVSHQKDLNFKPGEKYLYCNTGFTLLGQIVKRVSGQSLREFTTERIFKPLHMNSTHFRDDHAEIVKNIAYGYADGKGRNVYRLSVTNFDTVGATSLMTTVEDLAHWDENFYHPVVGDGEVAQQQLLLGKLNSGEELNYASGLVRGKYRGLAIVDHGGSDAGYRADLLRFPEQHFSVACLCNKDSINPSQLTQKVADIYLAKELNERPPVKAPVKPFSITSEQLSQYAGSYWKKDDERLMRFVLRDGKLFSAAPGTVWEELIPLSANRFKLGDTLELTFDRPGANAPLRLSMLRDGQSKPNVFEAVSEFKPSASQLRMYAGTYTSDEIEPVFRIGMEGSALVLKRIKFSPETLGPTVEDYFLGPDTNLHFQRDASGKVVGFLLNNGRIKNFRFKKVSE